MRRIVFGGLGVLVVLMLIGVSHVTGGPKQPPVTHPTTPHSTAAAASAKTDPEGLRSEKSAERETIEHFVTAYYNRDKGLLEGTAEERAARYKARLAPYASDSFLTNFVPPLTTPQDTAIHDDDGTVTARVTAFGAGHMDGKDAELEVTVNLRVAYPGEQAIVRNQNVVVYLTKAKNGWIVEVLEEIHS